MTWLTATEYLCHKWPQICSICPKALPGSFLIHDLSRACNYNNTTGAISEARTVYASEELKFTPGFFWPLCCLSFFVLRILITPLVSSNSSYKNIQPLYIDDKGNKVLLKASIERVGDFCSTPNVQFSATVMYVMVRTDYIQWNDNVCHGENRLHSMKR